MARVGPSLGCPDQRIRDLVLRAIAAVSGYEVDPVVDGGPSESPGIAVRMGDPGIPIDPIGVETSSSTLRMGSFLPDAGFTMTCTRGMAPPGMDVPRSVARD